MDEHLKEAVLIACSRLCQEDACPLEVAMGKTSNLCGQVRLYCEDAIDMAMNKLREEGLV